MTATSEDWRESHAAPLIMITLAGHCAVARARRPDRDGWRRQLGAEELVSIHEAGHAVAAVAVGHHQNGAAIERTENGCRGIAEHSETMLRPEARDHPTFEHFDELLPDFRKATAYAKLAVGSTGWLAYLRALWLRTDAILGQHWLAVKMLAFELQQTGTVRRDRAQELLDRWMQVRGESLFRVLANVNPQAVSAMNIQTADVPDGSFSSTAAWSRWSFTCAGPPSGNPRFEGSTS